jgi:hypothetical protein
MKNLAEQIASRHPATGGIARWFAWDHLRPGLPQDVSKMCGLLAEGMLDAIEDSPELTAGLRKLLEAKDCFVRAALDVVDGGSEAAIIATTDPEGIDEDPT